MYTENANENNKTLFDKILELYIFTNYLIAFEI